MKPKKLRTSHYSLIHRQLQVDRRFSLVSFKFLLINFHFFSPHAAHAGNGPKRLRTTKRKRILTASRSSQQTAEEEMGSNNRTLRSRSKMILSPTMNHGKVAGKRKETGKLTVEQNDRPEDHLVILINRLLKSNEAV